MPPLTKYTLRGVCPYPSLTYVLLPVEEPENLLVTMFGEQWWKLEWHVTKELNSWGETNFGSYMVDKVEEEEVLAAARTLGENVLLVYANDAAFNVGEQGLPEPLKV